MDIGKTAGSVGSGALGVWLSAWNWAQYDFAPWFSKLWITLVLWAIAIGAVVVGIIWDREFAASLSPTPGLEPSYQAAGVIISLGAVFLPSLAILTYRNKAYVSSGIAALMFVAVASASYSHSIGVQSQSIQEKYSAAKSDIVQDTVRVGNKDDIIATLEAQKARAVTDRDSILAQHERTIERIYNDGVSGISAADNRKISETEQLMDQVRREAKADIDRIEAEILAEKRDTTSEVAIAEDGLEKSAFNPLYILLGRFIHGEMVSDEQITQIAIRFSSYWASLIPFMGLLVSVLFGFHMHMAERQQSEKQRIIKKARDLERAKKAAETRRRNRLTYDADFDEVTPDNDDDEPDDEPLDEDPDIERQDEDDDDDKQQSPQAAE